MTDTKPNPLKERHYFHITRIIVETKTPLSIASGETDSVNDNLIVRDANGLPAIPGTTIAGVLRHLYKDYYNAEDECKQLFGTAKNKKTEGRNEPDIEQSPSIVHTSWGYLHNSSNIPVQTLLDPADKAWQRDKLIQDALQLTPIKRDHVKLTIQGTADTSDMGKFDRVSLTAGHRFSLEISLWSDQQEDPRWNKLIDLLSKPAFRLGGRTRAGLGKLEVIQCNEGKFNLQTKEGYEAFTQLGQDLSNTQQLKKYTTPPTEEPEPTEKIHITLNPEPEGYRFGSGNNSIDPESPADIVPVTEKKIYWNNNAQATITDLEILIPASSVKGALRHRTAYYYLLLKPEAKDATQINKTGIDQIPAIRELFGYIEGKEARPGNILIDDLHIPIDKDKKATMTLPHNSIDRFTGGVREHMLYFEETIVQKTPIVLTLTILNRDQLEADAIKALKLAITDLINERLALGAGSGRSGTGYFTGTTQPILKIEEAV